MKNSKLLLKNQNITFKTRGLLDLLRYNQKKLSVLLGSLTIVSNMLLSGCSSKNLECDETPTLIEISFNSYDDLNQIAVQAMECIKSSPLSLGRKNQIPVSLLEDVFTYYSDDEIVNTINNKLKNLHIQSYDYNPDDEKQNISANTVGYYDESTPNVIYIREDYIKGDMDDDAFAHSFVNLLQSNKCAYSYLKEAIAEIISNEYLNSTGVGNYYSNVINTKILMNVIGPKPIWEVVFSGNDTNLVSIIKSNLDDSKSNELISYLKLSPEEIIESNKEDRINELIDILYKNINSINIETNRNIYNADGTLIDKIYFNEDIMDNVQEKVPYIGENTIYSTKDLSSDVEKAMQTIYSSSLPFRKSTTINPSLLNDVFAYYSSDDIENTINNKFKNIHIETYKEDNTVNIGGYYDPTRPNVVYIREDYVKEDLDDDVFYNVFVSMLQSNKCPYSYLKKTVSEIIVSEYNTNSIDNYFSSVVNTKILMNVIGPKPIWEAIFSGNDTNLVSIIKSNLDDSKSDELISYLKLSPEEITELNKEDRINELIDILYKNINSIDIKMDRNIYNADGTLIDKVYFSKDRTKFENNRRQYYESSSIKEMFPDQSIRTQSSKVKIYE